MYLRNTSSFYTRDIRHQGLNTYNQPERMIEVNMCSSEPKVCYPFTVYRVQESFLSAKDEVTEKVQKAIVQTLNEFLSEKGFNRPQIRESGIEIIWNTDHLPELKMQINFFDFLDSPELLMKEVDLDHKLISAVIEPLSTYQN